MPRTLPTIWSFAALQDTGFIDGDGNVVKYAFKGVVGLPDVIMIPVGVKTVGDWAFFKCSSSQSSPSQKE